MTAISLPTSSPTPRGDPHRLPLHAWHAAHGARFATFAGWTMPVHYTLGILGEHLHTRAGAGLFDVSHMGQLLIRSRTHDPLDTARALERLLPVDLLGLLPGRQRYGLLTDARGGIIDDLMIANLGDAWFMVVNAANHAGDLEYLQADLPPSCVVEPLPGRALLAIQGPQAAAVLSKLAPEVADMRFMEARRMSIDGAEWYVSRSGYTGEDGFEVSMPVTVVETAAARLSCDEAVKLAGLGARDSLRLEAGLCLHGQDIGADTTPVEAALEWSIPAVRRAQGARAGGFAGAEIILGQLSNGATRRRVGLRPTGRPVRANAALTVAPGGVAIGRVTSGTFGPSAAAPVAMGYVPTTLAAVNTRLLADVRGQTVEVTVSRMPFVPHRYLR